MRTAALPQWTPPEDHGRRPYFLVKFSREVRHALSRAQHALTVRLRSVDRHDGSERQRRMYRQRVEACTLLIQCLVHYVDGVTLVVGKAEDGKFYGLRLDKIAELTGMGERRIDRAIRDLHAAGFLVSYTRAEKTQKGYRGLTAVRQLSAELFFAIGMGSILGKMRAKLYARRTAAQKPAKTADAWLAAKGKEFAQRANLRRRDALSLGDVLARIPSPST